ncbi:MAG: hypothetical protein B6242_13205 [Anaerolineaceae bacterium 4572_78]|nr:MAG: hypothetical protein B6242_13205 [Anaerolineaceae bacterium 4572_78]
MPKRPWWVLAVQMPVLKTTIHEYHRQQKFVIMGEPIIQSLTWIVYGPLFALSSIVIYTVLAWNFEVNTQSLALRLSASCAFILVPMIAWFVGAFIMSKITEPYINRQIKANIQHVEITIDFTKDILQLNKNKAIPLENIADLQLISDRGEIYSHDAEYNPLLNLIMTTDDEKITILSKELGTRLQKLDLLNKLEKLLFDT